MKEFKYVITDKGGIHARPAGALVKEGSRISMQHYHCKRWKSSRCKTYFWSYGTWCKMRRGDHSLHRWRE